MKGAAAAAHHRDRGTESDGSNLHLPFFSIAASSLSSSGAVASEKYGNVFLFLFF